MKEREKKSENAGEEEETKAEEVENVFHVNGNKNESSRSPFSLVVIVDDRKSMLDYIRVYTTRKLRTWRSV